MNLIVMFLGFLAKVGTVAGVFWFVVTRFLANVAPRFLANNAFVIGAVVAFTSMSAFNIFFYPFYVSPLRNMPTVKEGGLFALQVVNERPRGKSPLKWFKENPNADMLQMRGIFNEPLLFPASPEALRDVQSTNCYDWEKPWALRNFMARVVGFGLLLSEGNPHRKQRDALVPAFKFRNIRAQYNLMWDKTMVLLEELQKQHDADGSIEFTTWATRIALDVTGQTALSRDFGTLTDKEQPIASAFNEILEPGPSMLALLGMNFFIPKLITARLPMQANKIIRKQCALLRETCYGILREKHAKLNAEKKAREDDILADIIESGEFDNEEIVDQMLTFLTAGHDTTASALSWMMYLLATHPEIQQRLREEVHASITYADSEITYAVMEQMPYLNGCVEEVLRLHPPVPMTIRESVRQTTICGVTVPKDTLCLIAPYAINRHPLYWGADADEFKPERWIDISSNGTKRTNKHGGARSNYCESTFLHGPRGCIGVDLGKAELRCFVAGLAGRFEITMARPEQEIIAVGTIATKPLGGLHLNLKPVNNW